MKGKVATETKTKNAVRTMQKLNAGAI